MNKGKVWIIGCGPYDIGLLTLKGKYIIEKADIIVYDRLVSYNIINLSKEDAELIDVGKNASNHTMSQDEINKLLVKYALNGKNVARLKGGDPFVFGRGGEEIEELIKYNIEYEIVSGITSAISVPAYFGIPVTHRNFSSSLHIITGHSKNNEELKIDFNALVNLKGTLVFLMGISSLNKICEGLLNAGMNKDMPVCILENGTSYKQRNIYGNLKNIYEKALEQQVKNPAIIVVGEVCNFYKKYNWIKILKLSGARIIVTRPKNNNFTFSQKLRDLGADVIEIPTIKQKLLYNNNLYEQFKTVFEYDYIIFTSPFGADQFFNKLKELKIDIRKFVNTKFAVVGKMTGKVLEERGIFPEIIPEKYCSENLAIKLCSVIDKNCKVLLVRPKENSNELVKILNKNNIKVYEMMLYETIYEKFKNINYTFDYNDIITFTSSSSVKGFIKYMEDNKLNFENIRAICIGKQTEDEAKKYNMKTFCSEDATIDSLIEKIIEVYKKL